MSSETEIDDGGPVYPSGKAADHEHFERYALHTGVSLRDHFAGLAMQGLLASDTEFQTLSDSIAVLAYEQADEMIKRRAE